jgi:predicted Zn-dependent protease
MKKNHMYGLILFILSFFIISCSTVPITGRKQLSLVPASQMLSMSFQQYNEFLSANKKSNNSQAASMVQNVGVRIQKAVEKYFADHGLSNELKDYRWEFNLIESDEVNAWCMPGGKVVVYEGILPVTKDENGLAVVMGHEIAHAVAEHGNERVSQGLITQLGGIALSEAIKNKPAATQQIYMTAFGLGATVGVLLPFSRTHESEADRLGLIFMSMAGYDPNGAVEFWQRMAAKKGGAEPPEFLSTHPSDQRRINDIKEHLPEALKYYTAKN